MAENKKFYILINPKSGGEKVLKLIKTLRRSSKEYSEIIGWDLIDYQNLDQQLKVALVADILIIAGGDGTISYILGKLAGKNIEIGLLPLGTGNDLARELGMLPVTKHITNLKHLLNFYQTASAKPLTLFSLEYGENYSERITFANYLSFGFDAKVVASFDHWRKSFLGKFFRGVWLNRIAYGVISFWYSIYRLPLTTPMIVKNSNSEIPIKSAASVLFANIQSIVGLGKSNKFSNYQDQEIECLLIKQSWDYTAMLLGYRKLLPQPKFLGKSRSWVIENLPANSAFQLDGEAVTIKSNTSCRISAYSTVQLLCK